MITLKTVKFDSHRKEIQSVRLTVFTDEQGVDSALDLDGQDENAIQILALENGLPVGTGRMLADGHIGRIAVLSDYRKSGIGSQIMHALIANARKSDMEKVFLGAQVTAVPFYEKLGFSRYGDDYIEADILHTPMVMSL